MISLRSLLRFVVFFIIRCTLLFVVLPINHLNIFQVIRYSIMKQVTLLFAILFVSLPITGYPDGMEVSLTWQSQNADLDLYVFDPNQAVCDWTHNQTDWGCFYTSDLRGKETRQETVAYIVPDRKSRSTLRFNMLQYIPKCEDFIDSV
jgi:hypothetical protein